MNISVPIGNFVQKSLKMSFFRGKSGNREMFWISKFFWHRSICDVKIHFLSNFLKKYWFLRKLRHLPFLPIYKDIDQDSRGKTGIHPQFWYPMECVECVECPPPREKVGKVYFLDCRNRKYSRSWLHVYHVNICYNSTKWK